MCENFWNYKGESKSNIIYPQRRCKWFTAKTSNCLNNYTRHCYRSVSGLVSVVFLYKSSLKMVTPLLNCSLVEQRSVIHIFMARRFKIFWNQWLATSARIFWPSGFFYSTITHVCIPRHLLLRKSNSLNLIFSYTSHMEQIYLHWIITCLDQQKKPCIDEDLPSLMTLRA